MCHPSPRPHPTPTAARPARAATSRPRRWPLRWLTTGLLLLATAGASHAAGLLRPAGQDTSLQVRSHRVDVTLNNGFARTEIDQVFANTAQRDLEAVYLLPLPKQAALSELSLWIDGQEVLGEVLEKEQARQRYEEQRRRGNDTALAEKDGYSTFRISVGRVPAAADARVRVVYYQPIEIDLNVGRYLYPLAAGPGNREQSAFWAVDEQVTETFSFTLTLKSAFPVRDVRLPGYMGRAQITQLDSLDEQGTGDVYRVSVSSEGGAELSSDLVFYYRLDDSVPARLEVIPYRSAPGASGTFMTIITPAASLAPIQEGADWTFVLDISGSMGGAKLATLTDGVSRALGELSPQDRFSIITFNNKAFTATPSPLPATAGNVSHWMAKIRRLGSGGGTNLYAGLAHAYRQLDADRSTGVILVTDGVANVGPTEHAAFLELLRRYDVRLFTLVLGNGANQPLLHRLAQDSGGFAMNLSAADDIAGRLLQARSKLSHQCLHDVQLHFRGEPVTDLVPVTRGSLFEGQQLVQFGRYEGSGAVQVELSARVSGEERRWQSWVELPDVDTANPEIERLWALAAVDEVMREIREHGETRQRRQQVVDLATTYSLVTDYTAMVVLRPEVGEEHGLEARNADRVHRERQAQRQRAAAPVRNTRVDSSTRRVAAQPPSGQPEAGGGMFHGRRSPGFGTAPVGPLFVCVAAWLARRRQRSKE